MNEPGLNISHFSNNKPLHWLGKEKKLGSVYYICLSIPNRAEGKYIDYCNKTDNGGYQLRNFTFYHDTYQAKFPIIMEIIM